MAKQIHQVDIWKEKARPNIERSRSHHKKVRKKTSIIYWNMKLDNLNMRIFIDRQSKNVGILYITYFLLTCSCWFLTYIEILIIFVSYLLADRYPIIIIITTPMLSRYKLLTRFFTIAKMPISTFLETKLTD